MGKDDEQLKSVERRALTFIRNRLVHVGRGPSVRELASELGFQSPRSAALIINSLMRQGFLKRRASDRALQLVRMPDDAKDRESTIEVPLVGSAPCGAPLLAQENIEAMISVSTRLAKPGHRYFFLRAAGDSMTEAGIEDGALVLFRQQATAENGQVVVALVDDEATIKELRRMAGAVALVPRSKNRSHQPVVLRRDFQVQGVVVATVPDTSN